MPAVKFSIIWLKISDNVYKSLSRNYNTIYNLTIIVDLHIGTLSDFILVIYAGPVILIE